MHCVLSRHKSKYFRYLINTSSDLDSPIDLHTFYNTLSTYEDEFMVLLRLLWHTLPSSGSSFIPKLLSICSSASCTSTFPLTNDNQAFVTKISTEFAMFSNIIINNQKENKSLKYWKPRQERHKMSECKARKVVA